MPAVEGGWRKGRPASEVRHLPLTPEVLAAHLTGDVHIGLYPMLAGDQTCWLAADFDGQAAMLDALAYLKAARAVGAPAALEVSRSGIGAHVWVFFTDPVPAATARQLGTALVREAIAIRGRMDLRCYDRLFPSQDVLPGQGPGNLIAAPLHGRSPQARHHGLSRPGHSGAVRGPVGLPLHLGAPYPEAGHEARLALREPGRGHVSTVPSPPGRPRPSRIRHQSCISAWTARCRFPARSEPLAVRDPETRGVHVQPGVLRPPAPPPIHVEGSAHHHLLRRDTRRPPRPPARATRHGDATHRGSRQQGPGRG